VLKAVTSLKQSETVCARTVPSLRPSDIFSKRNWVSLGTSHNKGGRITRRHDEINYELANLIRLAFKKSKVRAEPRIFNGSSAANYDSPSPIVDVSGERGDLLVRGFWENSMDAIIDVRCVDTDAKSYNSREPDKVLKSAER
jgi:hypothetical protein